MSASLYFEPVIKNATYVDSGNTTARQVLKDINNVLHGHEDDRELFLSNDQETRLALRALFIASKNQVYSNLLKELDKHDEIRLFLEY